MAKLVTFLTDADGSVAAYRARNIELEQPDKSTSQRVTFGCTEMPPFSLCIFSLSLSVPTAPNATTTALSLALWCISIGRDRRNLISMKRALGDFIRATSYPGPVAAGKMFPRSIIPRTSYSRNFSVGCRSINEKWKFL